MHMRHRYPMYGIRKFLDKRIRNGQSKIRSRCSQKYAKTFLYDLNNILTSEISNAPSINLTTHVHRNMKPQFFLIYLCSWKMHILKTKLGAKNDFTYTTWSEISGKHWGSTSYCTLQTYYSNPAIPNSKKNVFPTNVYLSNILRILQHKNQRSQVNIQLLRTLRFMLWSKYN